MVEGMANVVRYLREFTQDASIQGCASIEGEATVFGKLWCWV